VRKSDRGLRLRPSLVREAERVVKAGRTTLSQFVNVAVAEKLSALRTSDYFRERAAHGDLDKALALLDRAGDESPAESDEITTL
jgi:hypothetical protein